MTRAVFLTPAVRALLDALGAPPPASSLSPSQLRDGLSGAIAAFGWPKSSEPNASAPLGPGAAVHLFHPTPGKRAPVIVYAHGGSFIAGGLKDHASACRTLAALSGCAVALADYRLAPEHPAPAALEDVLGGVATVRARASDWRIDADRLALLGDSAGGALAAAAALTLRDAKKDAQLLALVNPMTSPTAQGGSLDSFATGYFATAVDFADAWMRYGTASGPYHDLLAVGELAGLPPLLVWTNEADPVRDQGEAFAERVAAAGGTVVLQRVRGLIHAAWLFARALPEARILTAVIAGAIAASLNQELRD